MVELTDAPPPDALPLSSLRLAAGSSVEVCWDVEMTDGTDAQVWWKAEIHEAQTEEAGHLLVYEADHGFEAEERTVIFTSSTQLTDVELAQSLEWRELGSTRELADVDSATLDAEEAAAASSDDDAGPLQVGVLVKAQLDGSGAFFSAVVAASNDDGTLDLQCDDQTLVQGVPRERVQPVAVSGEVAAALGREEEECVEGVDAFFNTFVQALTSGAMFAKLSPEQQAVASAKVRGLRPHFEAELEAFRSDRGLGAVVTGEDIQAMLPRVMARSAAAR